jgi:hypothetical protein
VPRLCTPESEPTVTMLTVLTETTRSPARRTGPASGSSTRQNRAQGAYPIAVADCFTSSGTDASASVVMRIMSATAYTVRATTTLRGSMIDVPMIAGMARIRATDGIV